MASEASINDWVVALSGDELRQELAGRGLDTAGTKADLQRRLAEEVYVERGVDQPVPTPPTTQANVAVSNDPPPPYELPISSVVLTANSHSRPIMSGPRQTPLTSSPIDTNRNFEIEVRGIAQSQSGTIPRTTGRHSSGMAALSNANSNSINQESGYLSQTNAGYLPQNTTGYLGNADRLSLGGAQRPLTLDNNATGQPNRSFMASTAISNARNPPIPSNPDGYLTQQNATNNHVIHATPNQAAAGNILQSNSGYNSTNPRRVLSQIDNILPSNYNEGYLNNFPNEAQNNPQRAQGYVNNNITHRQFHPPVYNRERNTRSVHFNDATNNSDRRLIIPTPISAFDFIRKWNLKYSGRRDEDSEEFLKRVKEGRFIMHISDYDLFGILPFFLEGVALQWYRNNLDNWDTFEQFEEAWRARFSDADFQWALMENARRRTQGEREPVVDYLTYIKGMFNRMAPPLGPAREIELALRNMLPRLQTRIDKADIFTFQQLEAVAVQKEKSLIIARSYKPPPNVEDSLLPAMAYRDQRSSRPVHQVLSNLCIDESTESQPSKDVNWEFAEELPPEEDGLYNVDYRQTRRFNNDPRPGGNFQNLNKFNQSPNTNKIGSHVQTLCYNCGRPGHLSRDCQNPKRIVCYKCGKTGVKFTTCPACHPPEIFCTECGLVGYLKTNCPECSGNTK